MRKKKSILVIVSVLIVFTYVILVATRVLPVPFGRKAPLSSDERNAIVINENKLDAMLYGQNIDLNTELVRFRKLNSITSETISRPSGSKFSYLVINDLDDSIVLSDEEIRMINEYIQTPGSAVLYFGNKYLNAWDQPGWGPPAMLENIVELSVEYTNEKGTIIRCIGTWTEIDNKEHPEALPSIILDKMVFMIEANS